MKFATHLRSLALATLVNLAVIPVGAQNDDGSGSEHLGRITNATDTAEDWLWATRNLADTNTRDSVRQALSNRETYPRQPLVNLLTHSQLIVRLGALELLEEAAGSTFEYNPWNFEPEGAPLKAWQNWAGLTGEVNSTGLILSPEQLQAYLRDIISGNSERKRRAIRMLSPDSLKAVASIQEFIVANPGLPTASHLSLKEAQYNLVLTRITPKTAAILARDLTRGNQDQQLSALSGLKNVGFLAIPIVRDFLNSNDALIRETSIDTILALGGAQTVPLVTPTLTEEKDINVIHAAMRRLREIGGDEAKKIALHYLDHKDEDIVISALQTATKLWGGDDDYFSFDESPSKKTTDNPANPKVVTLLSDPRWRVRVTALEYVSKIRVTEAGEEVVKLLKDDDSFVRANAIDAVVSLNLRSATEEMENIFLSDEEMIGPITSAFSSLGTPLPDKLITHLDKSSPDALIAAIKAISSDKEPFLRIVTRYAKHQNLDVACTALRSLADDTDKVKQDFVANYLTEALQSGSPEKKTAILSALRYPSNNSSSYGAPILPPANPTSLDHLYDAFTKLSEIEVKTEKAAPAAEAAVEGGKEALKDELIKISADWSQSTENTHAYRAGFILAYADIDEGFQNITKNFSKLTTSQRAAIADDLYSPRSQEAPALLLLLLQDDVSEVRTDAAYTSFGDYLGGNFITEALDALTAPDTKLKAHEAYSYRLESSLSSRYRNEILTWARSTLADTESIDENKILSLILLRNHLSSDDKTLATYLTVSNNQWLRRAAWHALAASSPTWVSENLASLQADSSPAVRLALPMSFSNSGSNWQHYFNDINSQGDRASSSDNNKTQLTDELETTLREFAEKDPDSRIRFESWFALMVHRKEIDLRAFTGLIGEQEKEANVPLRLAKHIERNYASMGKAMRPLMAYTNIKAISPNKLPVILNHFSDNNAKASFTSFEALAKSAETTDAPQQIEGVETLEEIAAKREHLKVLAFYKPGCRECEKAERNLESLKTQFPLLEIERVNISDQNGLILNQILCSRLKISGVGKTPSFFTQAGATIAPKVTPQDLTTLLQSTMETKDDPTWADFDAVETEQAKEDLDENFSNITLALVIGGGLLDGINPCAFATIIFFLSYLQVAKRSPREILMVGGSFILAIFLAYFSVGLIFHAAIEKLVHLDSFKTARVIMTWTFAFFAFLVAALSLRDGIRASRGNISDMTLQLPDFLKNRIRGTIRKRARSRNFVVAAFITGIIISILELACTGQVYAPIVYQIQQGRADAVTYLLIYNLAFILPLVIIFVLAYRGMTSEALVRFQKNHTATVKYATAILFFALTLIILFGDKIFPH